MKKRKLFLISIAAILTAVFLFIIIGVTGLCVFAGRLNRTINLERFVNVEFNGLNGNGTARITANDEAYSDVELLEKLYPDVSTREALLNFLDLMNNVEYTLSKETGLSNGDKITIKVNYDDKLFKKEKIYVKNSEFTVKVAELSDGKVIDVFDGLEVFYEGFSGKGYAMFGMENCTEFVKDNVRFQYDESDFSNGDIITVTAIYDERTAEDELIIVKSDTKEYTVSGLTEPVEIDPFEKLEITYTGASPYINAVINSTKCDSMVNEHIKFKVEDKHLRNGDTFTITAVYNEYDAEKYGFIVTTDTHTYTVENQPEYVTSLDDLDLTALQSDLDDKLTVMTTANKGDLKFAGVYIADYFQSISSNKLKSSYLVSLKTSFEDKFDGYSYNYNRYIKIYEYTINAKEEQKKVYVAVYVNNIQKNADGSISWDIELGATGDENYATLVNKFATSEKEFYNVSEITTNTGSETKTNTNNNSEASFTGTVNTEKDPLNVRKSPSTESKTIGRIDKGSTVTIYSESDGWYEIEYNGGVGYVSKEYINTSENSVS